MNSIVRVIVKLHATELELSLNAVLEVTEALQLSGQLKEGISVV